MSPSQAAIRGIRSIEEWMFSTSPVKFPAIHNDAGQTDSMPADPFGARIGQYISTEFQWLAQVGSGKCGIYNQR